MGVPIGRFSIIVNDALILIIDEKAEAPRDSFPVSTGIADQNGRSTAQVLERHCIANSNRVAVTHVAQHPRDSGCGKQVSPTDVLVAQQDEVSVMRSSSRTRSEERR